MKLQKLSSSKLDAFSKSELVSPHLVYGGYKGETQTETSADQIKTGGKTDSTEHGSGTRNDGFGNIQLAGGILD